MYLDDYKTIFGTLTIMRSGDKQEKDMPNGDDYSGRILNTKDVAPDPAAKTVKNAWQINVAKWFDLRKPTDEAALTLSILRTKYLALAHLILDECPANPDRTHAIRQLKESMQTAISSIVCSDTWDDIPGPKGD